MPSLFTEDTFEQAVIELLENMGYGHIYAPDMDRDYSSPLLDSVLRDSLVRINKGLAIEAIEEAISKLKNLAGLLDREEALSAEEALSVFSWDRLRTEDIVVLPSALS